MQSTEECNHDHSTDEFDDEQNVVSDAPRKLPPWVIPVAIVAFVVFNAFFLVFAMQMGTGAAD